MSDRELLLETEIAALKDRIAELTGQSAAADLRRILGLSGRQAALLALLCARPATVSREAIYSTVFEYDTGDGPDERIILTVICKIRARLRSVRAPGRIENTYGVGYSLTADLRAWLKDCLATGAVIA